MFHNLIFTSPMTLPRRVVGLRDTKAITPVNLRRILKFKFGLMGLSTIHIYILNNNKKIEGQKVRIEKPSRTDRPAVVLPSTDQRH